MNNIKKIRKQVFVASIMGNILDHYDSNLYSFLAPFFAPYFFPKHDYLVALMLTYGLMSVSVITRPLGTIYWGKWASIWGPQKALAFTLLGIAISTGSMGFLPTYDHVGFLAPLFLGLMRGLQGFFAGGESAIAGLFMVSHAPKEIRGWRSSLYQSSTVLGIVLASGVATSLEYFGLGAQYWRWPFFLAFLTGIIGVYLRVKQVPKIASESQLYYSKNVGKTIWANLPIIIRIACVSSFTYLTYSVPFVFMNIFVPQISTITTEQMLAMNTGLLLLDMVLCPFFGKIADMVPKVKFMQLICLLLAVSSMPIFYLMKDTSLLMIGGIRLWIVLLGLGFLAPVYVWFYDVTQEKDRYLVQGLGYTLGTELVGRPGPGICLFLWTYSGSVLGPAAFVIFICVIASWGLRQANAIVME